MQLTGAEIICECLLEQGVDTVFGYPGGAALNTYDALYKYSDRINHILTAHEQGASHAADGYARSTGKTGVVMTTSGPGATNIVTGLATANIDSIPLVAITGNVTTDQLGRDSFQEVDIVDIVKPVTKASYLVEKVEDLADTIRKAFALAQHGRKGPVLVDVPKDVTANKTEFTPKAPEKPELFEIKNPESVRRVQELIRNSKRPMIYAGGGILSANASPEFKAFAELIDAPVCCSLMGLGCIPASHPLCVGNIGMHGGYESGMATAECDLMIACGARFSDRVAGDREKFGEQAKIVQLEIDEKEINKNVKVDEYILGDIKNILIALTVGLEQQKHEDWLAKIEEWKHHFDDVKAPESEYPLPQDILQAINEIKADDDIIATDVGQHQMWVAQYSRIEARKTLLTSGGMGTMGYGMGAAIGAQVSHPDKRVFLITGDGSFHMNLNELVTMKSYDLPVVVVVMNNSVLGMVRQWQKLFYGSRFSQTDPHRATDFVKLANAFGVEGMRITKPEEIKPVLQKAFDLKKPVVVDCVISPDVNVLPMIPPGKTIAEIVTEM
ncbi:biosynthetic-type acetolactate synthase large subunit [Ruminococcus sp.]|jgi:acetolactate synthase-1/2/3 large subunit|uniref:biosynthetic-type acetolactate synthase large subunit n=1 Tax=Ruminococcus sp. TaxID=41978 RepID=UPI0026012FF1|nr:biosynthetic-type acetolactate synthase large subunit [Ruminococcus sp.]MCI2112364.1 biosynthetic-type acetolactate synthase large subunit [Ruminococcus sp.]MDD6987997.1 biosynthetic-type acetolactate synthase large subunit [Ruminococcus sp.]MDY6202239.1 biosynthetic-type acetolactate synthase large subunit [Ruminococcus sp.]